MTRSEQSEINQQRSHALLALRVLWSATDNGKYMHESEKHHVRKVMAELVHLTENTERE